MINFLKRLFKRNRREEVAPQLSDATEGVDLIAKQLSQEQNNVVSLRPEYNNYNYEVLETVITNKMAEEIKQAYSTETKDE
jgi:hypothetical protein